MRKCADGVAGQNDDVIDGVKLDAEIIFASADSDGVSIGKNDVNAMLAGRFFDIGFTIESGDKVFSGIVEVTVIIDAVIDINAHERSFADIEGESNLAVELDSDFRGVDERQPIVGIIASGVLKMVADKFLGNFIASGHPLIDELDIEVNAVGVEVLITACFGDSFFLHLEGGSGIIVPLIGIVGVGEVVFIEVGVTISRRQSRNFFFFILANVKNICDNVFRHKKYTNFLIHIYPRGTGNIGGYLQGQSGNAIVSIFFVFFLLCKGWRENALRPRSFELIKLYLWKMTVSNYEFFLVVFFYITSDRKGI